MLCGVGRWLALGAVLGVCALAVVGVPSMVHAQASILPNGDFEDGLTGWAPPQGASVEVVDLDGPVGAHAARVTVTGAGLVTFQSQYWLAAIEPGASYRLEAWVLVDDPGVASMRVELDFVGAGASVVGRSADPITMASVEPGFRAVSSQPDVAPVDASWVRVSFVADAAAGASFAVDGVRVVQVSAAPEVLPTPVPTATPVPTVIATPGAGTGSGGTSGGATPTPTSTPVGLPPEVLRNPSFEEGTAGWSATGGVLSVGATLGAGYGQSLELRANGSTTAWAQQLVTVTPRGWFEAGAMLAPLEGVASARVRVAWYATADGSGAQISTVDSEALVMAGANSLTALPAMVTTGPVQAPPNALTARVRILLQPSSSAGGWLVIDDVVFHSVPAPAATVTPEAPSSTPTSAAPTVTPASTAIPVATAAPAAGAVTSPPARGGTLSSAAPSDEEVAAQRWLRITEVLSDPIQPGRDADWEWVEITNFGTVAVDLGGMMLRDNAQSTRLPSLVVPAGGSVVLGALLAEVAVDAWLPNGIGNGLGNTGDVLELLTASGESVDALGYGTAGPLPAPPAGRTLHRWFDEAGRFIRGAVGDPTPGVYVPWVESRVAEVREVPGEVEEDSPTAAVDGLDDDGEPVEEIVVGSGGGGANELAWVLLLALAGGAAGGALIQKMGQIRRS